MLLFLSGSGLYALAITLDNLPFQEIFVVVHLPSISQ